MQLHLDDEMLGLNPAIDKPVGYTGSHVFPVGVNVLSYTLTGHAIADDGTGHGHGHGRGSTDRRRRSSSPAARHHDHPWPRRPIRDHG